MKKVSIIVPVYNIDEYIEECVHSLLNQTYQNIEIILIDDGSNDNSASLCDKFESQNANIRTFHQANQGLAAARNKGISEAMGDYLLFVDGDDWINEKMVQVLVWLLEENNADATSIIRAGHQFESGEVIIGEKVKMLLHILNTSCFEIWGKLFKKELFDNIDFPSGKIHEDLYTLPKLIAKCKKIVVYHRGLYNYRQRDNSIMGQAAKKYYYDLIECCIEGISNCDMVFDEKGDIEDLEKWYLYHILWYYYNVICIADTDYCKKASKNVGLFYKKTRKCYWKNSRITLKDKIMFTKLSLIK